MRCDQCHYWVKQEIEAERHKDDWPGECHRYPPQMNVPTILLAAQDQDKETPDIQACEEAACTSSWAFPMTRGEEWCGEFRSRESPPRT